MNDKAAWTSGLKVANQFSVFLRYLCLVALLAGFCVNRATATVYQFIKIADSGPDSPYDSFQDTPSPVINNHGEVAFQPALKDGNTGLFSGTGGANRTIVSVNPASQFQALYGCFSMNDAGEVAFVGTFASSSDGVFVNRGGQIYSVFASTDATNLTLETGVAINNAGQIAFNTSFST